MKVVWTALAIVAVCIIAARGGGRRTGARGGDRRPGGTIPLGKKCTYDSKNKKDPCIHGGCMYKSSYGAAVSSERVCRYATGTNDSCNEPYDCPQGKTCRTKDRKKKYRCRYPTGR